MILPKTTIAEIKKKSGLLLDNTKDFESLASDIKISTGRHMGVTTLKRMLGYIDDDRKTYEYSLNTIAIYLGYENWNAYLKAGQYDSIVNYRDDSVYIQTLVVGTMIEVKYLNRIVILQVVECEGINALSVIAQENSSLCPEDILFVHRLKIGECIEAEKLIRSTAIGNYKTNSAITALKILPGQSN